MPIAEDPEPRPSEGGEPGGSDPSGAGGKDPFADLVLDEEFVRSATVKEQSGRTRMLAARWKHTPPVDPGGRRSVNDGPAAPQGGTARPVGLVEPAAVSSGDTWTTRTIVRRVGDYRFYDPDRHQVDAKKIVFGKAMSDVGNNACSVYDGFVHPQFRQFARPHPEQTGPTTDPYDRSHDLAPSGQCGTTSRE
ncbi:hypothetical protein ACFV1W_03300 [Kitasatospora sp. NPDC059648]|uniref:SCO2583/SCO2584 N-terminal domain-containing protein n=1 Tax=Kitasatospora sp. NPDC059648 TaxID=3346894 RepID=UPI0036A3D21F